MKDGINSSWPVQLEVLNSILSVVGNLQVSLEVRVG